MKETVKQYTYYKLGKTKPQTVQNYINSSLPMFIEYCSLNGIHSFSDVTLEDYLNFKYKYLKPLVGSLEVQLNGKESVG